MDSKKTVAFVGLTALTLTTATYCGSGLGLKTETCNVVRSSPDDPPTLDYSKVITYTTSSIVGTATISGTTTTI